MENILQKIVARAMPELAETRRRRPEMQLRATIAKLPRPRSFAAAFPPGNCFRVIAELKPASPSRGTIREPLAVPELARELEDAGAAALSIITEKNFFHGDLDNLRQAAQVSALPLLRKDFIFDAYQLLEARANGASAVLLIAAMFNDIHALTALIRQAHALDLEVLGEAHNAREVELLQQTDCDCIGINARDLSTFKTDLKRVEQLLQMIGADRIAIAESAITRREDMERLAAANARGFLIGTALMLAPRPGAALRQLLEARR